MMWRAVCDVMYIFTGGEVLGFGEYLFLDSYY